MLASVAPSDLLGWLVTIGGIVLVDLALSGDNALIIGAAASRLPRRQRLIAIFWGGLGAIVLRIVLTAVAARLLLIPLVQTAGAVIIMIITIRLLIPERPEGDSGGGARRVSDRLGPAILTILAADASMSLDNVLAIGALSAGNIPLLVFGLLLSMVLLMTTSAIIARLIERFAWLMDLTALVLAYTAAGLTLRDPVVSAALNLTGARALELTAGLLVFTALLDVAFRAVRARRQRRANSAPIPQESRSEPARTESDDPVGHPLHDR